jgi:type IV pilus assembly protein PilQ
MTVTLMRTHAARAGRVVLLLLIVGLSSCSRPTTVLRVAAPTRAARPLLRHDVAPIPLSPPADAEPGATATADGEPVTSGDAPYEYAELNKVMDVDWPGDDIRNVASDITFETNVTVQVGPLVVGSVSLAGTDMPVGLILDLITTAAGATYVRQAENVYLIAAVNTKSPAFASIAEAEVVTLEYVKITQLRDLLPDYLLDYVRLSSDEPHALVTAPRKLRESIIRIIRAVDQPQTQLVMRALVVELSEEAARELGFQWAIDSSRTPVVEGGSIPNRMDTFSAAQSLQDGVFSHDLGTTFVGEFTHKLQASLRNLVENGKAQIRVDTRLMTQNGKPADLNFRLQQFFRIETGTVAFPRIDLEKIESGVKLEATPQISRSGYITLDLSTTVDDVVALSSNGLPVVQTRNVNSTVRVRDGDTIVIAGMVEERESEIAHKVPLLGQIPIFGRLFSSTRTLVSKREVAIFITPEILPDSGSTWEWDFALAE